MKIYEKKYKEKADMENLNINLKNVEKPEKKLN